MNLIKGQNSLRFHDWTCCLPMSYTLMIFYESFINNRPAWFSRHNKNPFAYSINGHFMRMVTLNKKTYIFYYLFHFIESIKILFSSRLSKFQSISLVFPTENRATNCWKYATSNWKYNRIDNSFIPNRCDSNTS